MQGPARVTTLGDDEHIKGYVYAEGGSPRVPGTKISASSHLTGYPATGLTWPQGTALLDLAYRGSIGVEPQRWRELCQ